MLAIEMILQILLDLVATFLVFISFYKGKKNISYI